jgi:hypothetical protein
MNPSIPPIKPGELDPGVYPSNDFEKVIWSTTYVTYFKSLCKLDKHQSEIAKACAKEADAAVVCYRSEIAART